MLDVRSEWAFSTRSTLVVNSSGLFRKTQSLPAPASTRPDARIKIGSVNHRFRIVLLATTHRRLYTSDKRGQIGFKKKEGNHMSLGQFPFAICHIDPVLYG